MKAYCRMEHGNGKSNSEDRVLINNTILADGLYYSDSVKRPTVIAIADGVGGNPGGYLAAHMAVEGLLAQLIPSDIDEEGFIELIKTINNKIIEKSYCEKEYSKMASTLSGVFLSYEKYLLFHVGNTRVYTWENPYLTQLTEDHTFVKELRLLGLSEEEIRKSARSSEINSCLGNGDIQTASKLCVKDVTNEIQSAKMVILTSDGIHDYIGKETFENSMTRISDIPKYMQEAFAYARSTGSKDDLSMIVVDMDNKKKC